MDKKLILEPDLIPRTSFFRNLRALLKTGEWDIIRRSIYAQAGHKCEICNGVHYSLHCHEVWAYDEKAGIQQLAGLICLCPDCHESVHYGLAEIRGRSEIALKHIMVVNGIDRDTALAVVKKAFDLWRKRSTRFWTLDVSLLKTMLK